jgi:predicted nucleotidyltransferase
MGYIDYEQDLLREPFDEDWIEYMLDLYFHSGQSHVFYGAHPDRESKFKRYVASELRKTFDVNCHPLHLFICGSAHLGFSPAPEKLGNPFSWRESDIDIAVVSPELFDRWWSELQLKDTQKIIKNDEKRRIADDLFRGFINPSNVSTFTNTGRIWRDLFDKLKTDRANRVRGRLYRSHWFMQNYHRLSIIRGREKRLLGLGSRT